MIARPSLKLLGRVVVDAVDHSEFVQLDVGDLFEIAEALRNQQLRKEFVKVERVHEQLRPLLELCLTTGAFLLLGHDIDVEPGELARESHVLAAAPDRQTQLVLRDHDFNTLGFLVQHDLCHLGRLQRIHQERRQVLVPRDDVDLLALKLIDDSLHAAAAHADAGTYRVDRGVVRRSPRSSPGCPGRGPPP